MAVKKRRTKLENGGAQNGKRRRRGKRVTEKDKNQKAGANAVGKGGQREVSNPRVDRNSKRRVFCTLACNQVPGLHCWATVPGTRTMISLRVGSSYFTLLYFDCHRGTGVSHYSLLRIRRAGFVYYTDSPSSWFLSKAGEHPLTTRYISRLYKFYFHI